MTPPRMITRVSAIAAAAAVALTLVVTSTGATQASSSRAPGAPGAPAATSAPSTFVEVSQVVPAVLRDIRYKEHHNFIGRPIVGYHQPLCILTRPAADALRRAQFDAIRRGYLIKVYDCYRPQRAVNDFVAWAKNGDERMKAEFYPRIGRDTLFRDGYIAEKSGHSRGSTVDLTLVKIPPRAQPEYVPGQPLKPCYGPVSERFADNTVDMATGFDCFDTLANTLDPRVTGKPLANRLLLKGIMERAGFRNYDLEWWHYTLAREPYPATFFDFPVAWSSLRR